MRSGTAGSITGRGKSHRNSCPAPCQQCLHSLFTDGDAHRGDTLDVSLLAYRYLRTDRRPLAGPVAPGDPYPSADRRYPHEHVKSGSAQRRHRSLARLPDAPPRTIPACSSPAGSTLRPAGVHFADERVGSHPRCSLWSFVSVISDYLFRAEDWVSAIANCRSKMVWR